MTRVQRVFLSVFLVIATLSSSLDVFSQTAPPTEPTPTTEVKPTSEPEEPTEIPPTDVPTTEIPDFAPTEVVSTEVPPTDVPATEMLATEVPATETAVSLPPTAVSTEVPSVPDAETQLLEGDDFRAAVVISGAIQSVTVSPETLAAPGSRITLAVEWAVPDTAIEGDSFKLTLDPRLNVADDDFPLLNGNGDIVAIASLRSGVVTFTLTEFANDNVNISGNAFFFSTLKNSNSFQGQAVNLNFTDDSGRTFQDTVNVPVRPTPTLGPSPTPAPTATPDPNSSKSVRFARSDQGKINPDNALNWTINGPIGPQDQVRIVDNVPAGASWVIDCSTVSATLGAAIDCTPTSMTVTFGEVPAGARPRVTFKGDVTGTQTPGQLRSFPNTAIVFSEGAPAGISRSATANQTSGGGGAGGGNNPPPSPTPAFTPVPPTPTPTQIPPTPTPTLEATSPVLPTIVQSVCKFGSVTLPRITLAANSAAITYAQSGAVTPGGSVKVTATLGAGFTWESTDVPGWTFTETTATFVAQLDNPECTSVSPVLPDVTQAVCDDGVISRPRVALPANEEGITSTKSGEEISGGAVTVVARLADGFAWADTSLDGWTFTATTATLVVELDPVACAGVLPVLPVVAQGSCDGGVLNLPESNIAAQSTGVTYASSGDAVPGGTIVYTATLEPGFQWSGEAFDDWVFGTSTATYTVTFDPVDCVEVAPIQPLVTQAVCDFGSVGSPVVILAEDTDAVTYVVSGAQVPGGTVTVTATVQGVNGFVWPTVDVPAGWTFSGDTATYTFTLDTAGCGATALTAPDVTQASCFFGGVQAASVYLPLDTEGIFYEKAGIEAPGETVVVTARLKPEFSWESTDVEGWEFTPALATRTILLDTPLCAAAIPSNVEVTQSTCEFGLVNPPVILISGNTESVFYSFDGPIEAGATVRITATLEDGFAWDDTTVPGWTFSESSATYTVVLEASGCEPADPGLPVITEGSCFEGVLTTPSLELPADSDAVTYTRIGNDVPGGTVVIRATLNPGFSWSDTPVAGWVYTTPSATFTSQYAEVPCAEVLPVAPLISLGDCVEGELTGLPTVQLAANTEALGYTLSGDVQFVSTIVITATLADGFRWAASELEGWVFTSPTTATFTTVLVEPDCDATPIPDATDDTVAPDGSENTDDSAEQDEQGVTRLPSTGTGSSETPFLIGILGMATLLLILARIAMIWGSRAKPSIRRQVRTPLHDATGIPKGT